MPNTSSSVFGHGRPTVGPTGPVQVIAPTTPAPPNTGAGRFLGNNVEYKTTYDPTLLQPVDRQDNRTHLGISKEDLPFVGYDVWNAYEISCLLTNGIPVVGLAKIIYPANSPNIVESKSLKLYLNSFNMTKVGDDDTNADTAREIIASTIAADLKKCVGAAVDVTVFPPDCESAHGYGGVEQLTRINIDDYTRTRSNNLSASVYNEDSKLLELSLDRDAERLYVSNLLRSNCKVTAQPDWGTVYVYTSGSVRVVPESLLKYIISFRNENHFHEEICETIYKRLHSILGDSKLAVACLYTRRGGIDINPIRGTSEKEVRVLFNELLKTDTPSLKTSRQ